MKFKFGMHVVHSMRMDAVFTVVLIQAVEVTMSTNRIHQDSVHSRMARLNNFYVC